MSNKDRDFLNMFLATVLGILTLLALTSCSIRTAQIDKPDGTTLYYWRGEVLTFSQTSGTLSYGDVVFELDQSEHRPDADSIRALSEGFAAELVKRLEGLK